MKACWCRCAGCAVCTQLYLSSGCAVASLHINTWCKAGPHCQINRTLVTCAAVLLSQVCDDVAAAILGKSLFVNWPHLEEARVVAVSDGETK